jgi:hypothetical protein
MGLPLHGDGEEFEREDRPGTGGDEQADDDQLPVRVQV